MNINRKPVHYAINRYTIKNNNAAQLTPCEPHQSARSLNFR